ncbi:MAG: DUF3526 domain-containing protein [Bacteroidota bacterium]
MYGLMFRQFVRSRTAILGMSLLLAMGLISIMIGKQFLADQEKTAAQVAEKQLDHIERNVDLHADDLGLLLYYLKFALVNEAHPLAGISIGQRDVNPSVISVNILTLEGQKYNIDLVNPTQLLYGNLDLSFMLIYVFPLIIIAFSYNLRSEEEESGTWRLVQVTSSTPMKFLLMKLSLRALALLSMMLILYGVAIFALSIPLSTELMAFMSISILYLLFWFALSFWIVSMKRNSNFNALSLLSIWLGLVVLLPATLNNYLTNKYPMPEALSTMIQQRDAYHQKWDTEKRPTMEQFYGHYPQYASFGYPAEDGGFSWLWYYAMQDAGDKESREQSKLMIDKILQREKSSKAWGYVIPGLHAQLRFNELAGTGLLNHMDFLEYVEDYHEKTRLYFYPKIFSEETAEVVEWEKFPPEYLEFKEEINWFSSLLPLLLSILLFGGLSFINFKKD